MGMSNITTRVNNQFPRPDLHRLDKQPYRLQTKWHEVGEGKGEGKSLLSKIIQAISAPRAEAPKNRAHPANELPAQPNMLFRRQVSAPPGIRSEEHTSELQS